MTTADYAEREYGITKPQMKRIVKKLHEKTKRMRVSGAFVRHTLMVKPVAAVTPRFSGR